MPIPSKKGKEDPKGFMSRCMSSEVMQREYPDQKQRTAICMSKACEDLSYVESAGFQLWYESTGDDKAGYPPNCKDGYIEKDGKCVPLGDHLHKGDKSDAKTYQYQDPKTGEIYNYRQPGIYRKYGRVLIPIR